MADIKRRWEMLINAGKSISIEVRVEDLPKPVLDHVIYIGLRNILMDSHAGKAPGDARTKVEAKLSAMLSGEVRTAVGVRGVKADPLTPAMVGMATSIVSARDVAELAKMSAKNRNRAVKERARKYIEEHRAELRAQVEAFLAPPAAEPAKPALRKRAA
jgi:translation initiation factor IF-2